MTGTALHTNEILKYLVFEIVIAFTAKSKSSFLSSFLLGTRHDSTDLLAVLILLILRDSFINIRIRVLSPGRPSLRIMPHSPYYFCRGGVHISLCLC